MILFCIFNPIYWSRLDSFFSLDHKIINRDDLERKLLHTVVKNFERQKQTNENEFFLIVNHQKHVYGLQISRT